MHWFAHSTKERWVKFPAQSGGWELRQPVSFGVMKLINKRQIPLWLGFNTGIPGAPILSKKGVKVALRAAA